MEKREKKSAEPTMNSRGAAKLLYKKIFILNKKRFF